MVISELEYHIALLFSLDEPLTAPMKSQLSIIVPDILPGFKGTLLKMKIAPEYLYIHCTAGAEHSPIEIAEEIICAGSRRFIRLHKHLEGYDRIFKNDIYVKSGKKPSKKQLDDFVSLSSSGI
jgi:hypothetical protein